MIEYLYDAIRAVAGQDIAVDAAITDDDGAPLTENCNLVLHFDKDLMYVASGTYDEDAELWTFTIPAEATKGRSGRYEYCIQHNGLNLCFKEPIYLIG